MGKPLESEPGKVGQAERNRDRTVVVKLQPLGLI